MCIEKESYSNYKLNVFGWTDNNQVWEVGKARWDTAIYQAEKAMQKLQHTAAAETDLNHREF